MVRATTAKSARSGTLCISASYLKFRFVSMHSLSVCSRRSFGTNQRTKGCGRVSTQLRCSPITATDEFLPHLPFLPSYVICNGYGDVLRSSATIAKSNSEIIAQVRVRGSPTPYNCFWIVITSSSRNHLSDQSTTMLVQTAKHVTRDLNPNDDLKNLRIKTNKKELIVSHNKDFNVVVIQAWTPAKDDPSHLVQQQEQHTTNR